MSSYMKRRYAKYMASPAWKELRAKARERSGNKCEFCGGPPEHVHHVRYPKRFEDDHLDNLVVACEPCHSKLHGIRSDVFVDNWVGTATGFKEIDLKIFVKMLFTPVPEDIRQPLGLEELYKHIGKEKADETVNQFDGTFFEEGKEKILFLGFSHPVFGSNGTNLDEFFANVFSGTATEEIENLDCQKIGEAVLEALSVGPVWCPFKKKQ